MQKRDLMENKKSRAVALDFIYKSQEECLSIEACIISTKMQALAHMTDILFHNFEKDLKLASIPSQLKRNSLVASSYEELYELARSAIQDVYFEGYRVRKDAKYSKYYEVYIWFRLGQGSWEQKKVEMLSLLQP